MEIGFNDDVQYSGVTFHIQTEDHGLHDPRVSTQLFSGGRVLDNKVVGYGHLIEGLVDEEERRSKIRKVMVASHRNVYKRLVSGDYDEAMGFGQKAAVGDDLDQVVEAFVPSQSRVAEAAEVIEDEDGRLTFTFDHGEQIDLSMLRKQLNQVDLFPKETGVAAFADLASEFEDDDEEADAPPPTRGAHTGARPSPTLTKFPRTGRRAFQGLLEQPSAVDVTRLVLDFLARR